MVYKCLNNKGCPKLQVGRLYSIYEDHETPEVHFLDFDGHYYIYELPDGITPECFEPTSYTNIREATWMDSGVSSKIPSLKSDLYTRLVQLGIIGSEEVRGKNIGTSDYSKHIIQPWAIWLDYNLNPWDADIVKRVLRTKEDDSRIMDYEKIIHICQERIRQLNNGLER